MVKKYKNLRFGEIKMSSSKTGESVGNAKQTIFYFWPCRFGNVRENLILPNICKFTASRFLSSRLY